MTQLHPYFCSKTAPWRNKELFIASVQGRFCYQIGSHFDAKLVTKINNKPLSICRAFRISTESLGGGAHVIASGNHGSEDRAEKPAGHRVHSWAWPRLGICSHGPWLWGTHCSLVREPQQLETADNAGKAVLESKPMARLEKVQQKPVFSKYTTKASAPLASHAACAGRGWL